MKNALIIFSLFAGAYAMNACKSAKVGGRTNAPVTTVVFEPVSGTYASMRIPALVLTKQGSLLAFCEGRIGTSSDWADMDMLMRRSTDGGKTWEPIMVIAPRQGGMPTSNATPIVDADGTIHLLYQRGYANAYYTKSTDDGKTWSPAVDITYAYEAFRPEYNWQVLAPGPGHAIQLKNGRLLVATWICNPAKLLPHKSHYPSVVATIYSDDHGATWKRGAILKDTVIKSPSETMPVQLDDGRVMLSIRHSGDSHRRGVSYSPDGISNWTVPALDTALYEPVCMASIIRAYDKGKPALLFTNPDTRLAPKPPRKNLTIKMSYDDGQSWPIQQAIDTSFAGYSDLAVDNEKGIVYCLYETNTTAQGWYYSLVLKRFTLDWIKGKK